MTTYSPVTFKLFLFITKFYPYSVALYFCYARFGKKENFIVIVINISHVYLQNSKQSMSESYQCMSNDLQTGDLEVQRRDQSNHMEIDTTAMKNVTNIGHKSKDTLSSTSTNEMALNSRISQEDDTSPVIPLQNKTVSYILINPHILC